MFPKNMLTFKKCILWQCLNTSHFAEMRWQRGLQLTWEHFWNLTSSCHSCDLFYFLEISLENLCLAIKPHLVGLFK